MAEAVGIVAPDVRAGGVLRLAQLVAVQGLAGVVAGIVVGGLGGRLAMRLSALAAGPDMVGWITDNGNRIGTISVDGTIELVIFGGVLFGAFAAVLLVILRPWLDWAGRWRGQVAGAALLGIGGGAVVTASNRDFEALDPSVLNVVMFAAIVFLYGWFAVALADRWLRHDPRRWMLLLYVPVVGLGLLVAFGVFVSFFSTDFCACDNPPRLVGVFVVLMGVAAGFAMLATAFSNIDEPGWLRPAGITFAAAAFVTGGVRLVNEVMTIL